MNTIPAADTPHHDCCIIKWVRLIRIGVPGRVELQSAGVLISEYVVGVEVLLLTHVVETVVGCE